MLYLEDLSFAHTCTLHSTKPEIIFTLLEILCVYSMRKNMANIKILFL